MKKTDDYFGCAVALAVFIVIVGLKFLFPLVEMWLWNGMVHDMFNLPEFGYWQIFCFDWLIRLFFRSPVNWNKVIEKV